MDLFSELQNLSQAARAGQQKLARAPGKTRAEALLNLSKALEASSSAILEANSRDLEAAHLPPAKLDRLRLTPKAIAELAAGAQAVAAQPDPLGETGPSHLLANGLRVSKMRIPLGVIGMIYEARPGATVEAAVLAIKSGNAIILRGGSEAIRTNRVLVELIQKSLAASGLPPEAVGLVPFTDREAVSALCQLEQIDVMIPRGGADLVRRVRQEARMPVLAHERGVVHLYVDQGADLAMAQRITVNSKVQRPAVCNALETLLVHQEVAAEFLPSLGQEMNSLGVELRADPLARAYLPAALPATAEDWDTEYLELILSVRVVANFEAALEHIALYSTRHTEAIVTSNYQRAQRFLSEVDASLVLVNASTRFNDGFQLGLGAEMGISTSKLHAYGPMGVRELTSEKFIALGQGQIRE